MDTGKRTINEIFNGAGYWKFRSFNELMFGEKHSGASTRGY